MASLKACLCRPCAAPLQLIILNARISFETPGRISARRDAEITMTMHTPNLNIADRANHFRLQNGDKAQLPFEPAEYEQRLAGLRATMMQKGLRACVLTSMHCVAYYSGFLYCSFGRPYAASSPRIPVQPCQPTSMQGNPGGAVTQIISFIPTGSVTII